MPQGNFVLTCFDKRLPFNATFCNKDKYVASLSSFANSIPVEEKTAVKGSGKNLSFITSGMTIGKDSNKLCRCIWQFVKCIVTYEHDFPLCDSDVLWLLFDKFND